MPRGVHGEKIVSAIDNDKMPKSDIPRLEKALKKYDKWISDINNVKADNLDDLISKMLSILNEYKMYIDVNLIFDSEEDFLYRQKGQLKLDNTVLEEFMPLFVRRCVELQYGECDMEIGSQTKTFSSVYFESSLGNPIKAGGMNIKVKAQDFSMSRKLYLSASYDPDFSENETVTLETNLGYVLSEIKTNLDKTMFQEASATAHDIKQAVTGAKYYLLCDFLDMPPISTAITDIDEILITRKAKRIGENIRKSFSTYQGRQAKREWYVAYLSEHPYAEDIFKRYINHVIAQLKNEELIEESVLQQGYF